VGIIRIIKKKEGDIMKRTMLYGLSVLIGLWLIMFQVPNISYGAPEPYVSTGFPRVVVVSGSNYDMGVQYGEQAAAAIGHNLAIMKSHLYEVHGKTTVDNDMKVWDFYNKEHDPGLQDWFKGIIKGCKKQKVKISNSDLVLLMVYPTELWARPYSPYPEEVTKGAKLKAARKRQLRAGVTIPELDIESKKHHSCNSFAATGTATPDGKPIIGITQMVNAQAMDTVILIAFPEDGPSWVSQPYAGRINSNSAMNSNGFAWTMTAILMDEPLWGLAPEAYFHYLAQYVTSPTAAQTYLTTTPRAGVTGGFTMADAAGNISVFECNALAYVLRGPGDEGETGPFTVMTNHLVDPTLQSYNPVWLEPALGTFTRYNTVFQFITEALGTIDFPFAKNMFASSDWYDADAAQWHYNDPGAPYISNDHTSVNQSIFFPADLIAYLQTGTPSGNGLPAYATGEYVKIKLAADANSVTAQAGNDALSLYWAATDLFEYESNAGAAYLTYQISESIKAKLDEAFVAFSTGMDREAYADLEEKDLNEKLSLYGEATTYYAKAQLYAQMVTTDLNKLQAQVNGF
jgi:hypothetical protein